MAKLASTTYGDALFEVAIEENELDIIMEEILFVRQAFLDNEELLKLLNHPKIVKDEKVKVIENVFKGKISDHVVGFLTLIVSKGRYNEISAIFEYFISRVKKYKRIGIASVTSAVCLTEEQREQVRLRLLELTSYISFEIDYTVDESIIGGMIIRIEDRVVDNSIKTKLENMSKSLAKIQLG